MAAARRQRPHIATFAIKNASRVGPVDFVADGQRYLRLSHRVRSSIVRAQGWADCCSREYSLMASSTSAGKPKPVRLPLRLRASTSGALRRSCCKSSVSDAREKAIAYGMPDVGAGATTDGIEQHLKRAVEGPKLSDKSPPIRLGQVSSAAAALLAQHAHAPESPVAGTTFSARRPPALRLRKWLLLAAIIGFAVSYASVFTFWEQEAGDQSFELASSAARPTERRSELQPRLVAHDTQGNAGQPVPLGLALQGPADGGVVVIAGLVPGMTLSSGSASGVDEWQVPATDLDDTWIGPPVNFVGAVELTAELRLPDATIVQRQVFHVEWITPNPSGLGQPSTPAEPEQVTTMRESTAEPQQATAARASTADPQQLTTIGQSTARSERVTTMEESAAGPEQIIGQSAAEPERVTTMRESASAKWRAIRQCWSIGQLVESSSANAGACR